MSLRTNLFLGVTLAIGLGFSATAEDTVSADTVLATVNGTEITVGHVAIARDNLPEQYQNLPPDVLFDGLLEQLISQAALAGTMNDIPQSLQVLLENNRRQAIANQALTNLITDAITEESIIEAYENTYADFESEREYNASHILVESLEEATNITEMARGGDDFAALAREHSTGPSGPGGGELGWFGLGRMVPAFETAVTTMEPGAISDPTQTQFGWHVIRLNEIRDTDVPALDDVRAEIVTGLEETLAATLVTTAVESAEVVRADPIDPAAALDPEIFNE